VVKTEGRSSAVCGFGPCDGNNDFRSVTIEYRQIEYALVQGVGGHLWKWSVSVAGEAVKGRAHTKAAAVAAAEKAIDRALAVKKVRLVPPQHSRLKG
jgi:hypothetical protein